MILILSDDRDYSTNQVIDWLRHFREDYTRINPSNPISVNSFVLTNKEISVNFSVKLHNSTTQEICSSSVKSFWYRRGTFNIDFEKISNENIDISLKNEINSELVSQTISIKTFLNYFSKNYLRNLGAFEDNATDKLSNLLIAKKSGLSIPETKVLSNKKDLEAFYAKSGNLVSKPMSQGSVFGFHSKISGFTILIDANIINEIPDSFFPTQFQECLNKKFEIRCFYLDGKIYSMAIFSQNDKKTKIDFRNYNAIKPNRTVPFKLPKRIEEKIVKFMKLVDMNCGSIDLIYTVDKKFVFLEVNPVGQFYQVSYPCNYNLERKIAEYLTNKK
jgi:ATP-GRASP peptide maturase of grasp-with-spasm system